VKKPVNPERAARESDSPVLSLIFPYYDNPKMLAYQLEYYAQLPDQVASKVEIVLVDDASSQYPAADLVPQKYPMRLSVFRIDKDKPWNQDAARNIGAYEATGEFLLLTDIDHVVPVDTLENLLMMEDRDSVITLARKAHFSEKVVHSHVNSYVMTRKAFWEIGGYDEDFWGIYGSDWIYRRQVQKRFPIVLRDDLRLELVTQGSIVDAKNKKFSRKPSFFARVRGRVLRLLKLLHLVPSPRTMTNPYRRVR
jgi:glycosyltransferase involved in cell wall biosynthesis